MRSIKETALAFDRACEAAGVRYALVGGFAVMAWGQPRATTDVDALARLEGGNIEGFVRALKKEGLTTDPEDLKTILSEGGHASVFDRDSSYHVDIKAARTRDEIEQVEAAITIPFEEGRLKVASAEHTVAYKLVYGSERDIQDARSILAKLGADIDRKRLRAIASKLGVESKLASLERETRE